MDKLVFPDVPRLGAVRHCIRVPSSKSCAQRAYALALLNRGQTTHIWQSSFCEDDKAALGIITAAGAQVIHEIPDNLRVFSPVCTPAHRDFFCGESGLAARMFGVILPFLWPDVSLHFTARGSLLQRPATDLIALLEQLGLRVVSAQARWPLYVEGKAQLPTCIHIQANHSAQVLSGLLLACAGVPKKCDVRIEVEGLVSKPYVDLSLEMIDQMGVNISKEGYDAFRIAQHQQVSLPHACLQIEKDWSAAAFWVAFAAFGHDIFLLDVCPDSVQADRQILTIARQAGLHVHPEPGGVLCQRVRPLRAFHTDATDCPDLFPPLVALATVCEGVSQITGVRRLFHKESNRAQALVEECTKLGVAISVQNDTMYVGQSEVSPAVVHAHNDHRIAMCLGILATRSRGVVRICQAQCVAKSYPLFWEDLASCGVSVKNEEGYHTP